MNTPVSDSARFARIAENRAKSDCFPGRIIYSVFFLLGCIALVAALLINRTVNNFEIHAVADDDLPHWVIHAKWTNPQNGKLYRFISDPLEIDPAPFLEGKKWVRVAINPDAPERDYMIDTTFLPELSE
ncbi:MAG: hypothetical protein D6717_03825 [Gammaproteobacteria bacterium]|nr:MAG: hypothetical protein D6717_03825 [Gammaproteobacteria bacterium]